MAKKYAFLFPGQGAQTQGMIKDIVEAFPEAKKVVDEVARITGQDIQKLLWEMPQEELNRSDNSQLAITTASLAIMAALKSKGIEPSCAMGFSLGEFPALYAAGILSFEDVIKVVVQRGKIMQEVCEKIAEENQGNAPGMLAVLGLPPEKVEEIAAGIEGAYAANLNSVKQTVLAGTAEGLKKAEEAAKQAGARRAVKLAVAGPFHSPLMQRAADNFKVALEGFEFTDPSIPLFSNVTGKKVTEGKAAKLSAVDHLTHPVRWTDEEQVLAELIKGDTENQWTVIEAGPGKVLSGLWGQTEFGAELPAIAVNTAEAINSL